MYAITIKYTPLCVCHICTIVKYHTLVHVVGETPCRNKLHVTLCDGFMCFKDQGESRGKILTKQKYGVFCRV